MDINTLLDIGRSRNYLYFVTFVSAIKGLSGAPIFNDKGELVSLYSQTLSSSYVHLWESRAINCSNKLPTIMKTPI